MEDVAFCERNTKAWVAFLFVFGVLVLAYSIWMAWERGEVSGFSRRSRGAQAAHGAPGPGGQPAHGGPQSMTPVAFTNIPPSATVPLAPAPQYGGGAPTPQLDAVTRATPMGGVQFIAGSQALSLQQSFNLAADVIRPSVVSINAVRAAPPPMVRPNGVQFVEPFDGQPDVVIGQQPYENVGSGVIVDPSGYLVTNRHVVEGASSIVVTRFREQQEHLPARLVRIDPQSDLALLQIMADGPFPAASLTNSSNVEVGDWVLAVGSPFGLQHTVTAGIVSGVRNSLSINGAPYRNLIQTDAPINKGSSGGPLVNMYGQVIGLNTAIYAPTGVFSGAGFAIPSNQVGAFVARTLDGLGVNGPAVQPPGVRDNLSLGLGVIDMSPTLAQHLSFPHSGGVFVSTIVLDSPADLAEIARGDIITSMNGLPIDDADSFRRQLSTMAPGQNVAVTVWRQGAVETLNLTLNRPAVGLWNR